MQYTRQTLEAFLSLQGSHADRTELLVPLVATASAVLFLYDLKEQRRIFLNQRLYAVLGYPAPSDAASDPDPLTRLVHPEDLPALAASLPPPEAAPETVVTAEYRLRHASGEWRWFTSRSTVCAWEANGKPLQILTTTEDVTERRQTETAPNNAVTPPFAKDGPTEPVIASRSFSERLQAVMALNNDLSRLDTLDELYYTAIERGRSVVGFDRLSLWLAEGPNVIQGTWGTDEHGNLRDERDKRLVIDAVPELEQEAQGEVQVIASDNHLLFNDASEPIGMGWQARAGLWDGRQMIGHLSADNLLKQQPWTEEDSELLRLFAINLGHLCTRKRMEMVLQENEARFRTLVDGLPDLVWLLNAENRILLVNHAWLEFTGSSLEKAAEFDWMATIHPDDRDRVVETFLNATAARKPYQAEYRIRRRDGKERILLSTAVPRTYQEGTFVGYLGSSIDITEQQVLRDQLFESQKLESMGRLAGGIAHDFNNLLTAILGYTELSLSLVPEEAEVRPFLNNVSAAAQRAAELTKQLLMYARRQMVSFETLDINKIILNMYPLLHRTIGEQYELVTVLAQDACCVVANASQMEQVLMNLVVNARDAMPEGGRILIETACITLDREYAEKHIGVAPGEYVLYSISDSGTGMTPEVRNRIFEPFYTTKEVGKGTGLGLATCYGIVKQSKGNIWVYSELDRGTTFKVYLPRVRDTVQSEPVKLPDDLPEGTETILLVDDEPMVRDIAARTLRAQGYRVLEASNGAEALHVQSEWPGRIDLLVSDVVMPLMGGKELAQRLQELRPALKVLYMSGYTQNVVLQQGVLKPGVVLLTKPFTAAGLSQMVRGVLGT